MAAAANRAMTEAGQAKRPFNGEDLERAAEYAKADVIQAYIAATDSAVKGRSFRDEAHARLRDSFKIVMEGEQA